MEHQPDIDLTIFHRQLALQVKRSLERAGLVSALLGFMSAALLLVLLLAGVVEGLEAPLLFAAGAGVYSLLLLLAARTGRLSGWRLRALILPFVAMPTLFFVATELSLPSGAATFIAGPLSYLYFHLILMTGFIFDSRLSVIAGLLSAVGYALSCWLASDGLAQVSAPDPLLLQDINSFPLHLFKALLMLFAGFLVAAMSLTVRRLVARTVNEERQRDRISRLFGQYVSQEVRDRIVSEKSEVKGEQREVTVLFSDLRGFSTLAEGKGAEEVVLLLNRYFDAMVGAISAHGGVVDKFIGDAVMGVFGGLIPLANPARSAVGAARAMRAALRQLNRQLAAEGRPTLDNGIGIHRGLVLQGPIGSSERKEFTVIGDSVNIAARLESLTRERGRAVLLSESVRQALAEPEASALELLGPVALKGRREEVVVYALPEGPTAGEEE